MRLSGVDRLCMVFVLDAFHNSLALAMALRILHVRIRPVFICFAGLFGAISALAAEIAHLSRGCAALLWLPIACGMMHIAAGRERAVCKKLGKAAVLLACEGFLGGVVLALHGATGSLLAAHVLSIGCAAAVFVSAGRTAYFRRDVCRVYVTCLIGERKLAFEAIIDSGNSLRDYLTHRPVIVAGGKLFDCAADVRTRPIFADTAGGRQMMHLIMPSSTLLSIDGEERQVEAALAFSPALRADAPALVPVSLIR